MTNISVVDDNTGYHLIIEEEFKADTDTNYTFKFFSDGEYFLSNLEAISAAKAKAKEMVELDTLDELSPEDVALAAEAETDLFLLDVQMPEFNVVKAVEKIDELCPMAYVIIISAYRDFDTLKELSNMGILRFCEKDETNFLTNLRKYIRVAERKIIARKSVLYGN